VPTIKPSPIEIFNPLDVWRHDLSESNLNFEDDESMQFDSRDSQDQDLYDNDDPLTLIIMRSMIRTNLQPYFHAKSLGVAETIAAAARITKVILLKSLFRLSPETGKKVCLGNHKACIAQLVRAWV
jgi:hypothetical protein